VRLVALSWGWDVINQCWVKEKKKGMAWHQWVVRLAKIGISLYEFDEMKLFNSMRDFLIQLKIKENSIGPNPHMGFDAFTTFLVKHD